MANDQHRLMFENIRQRFETRALPRVVTRIESKEKLAALQAELRSLAAAISDDYQAVHIIEQRIFANEQRSKEIFDMLGAATTTETVVADIDSAAGDKLFDMMRKLGQSVEIIYLQDKRRCKIVERKISVR